MTDHATAFARVAHQMRVALRMAREQMGPDESVIVMVGAHPEVVEVLATFAEVQAGIEARGCPFCERVITDGRSEVCAACAAGDRSVVTHG